MQEGKLSERALKRSVLRPLQQTVQKNHQNKAGTLEYGADCAALMEEAGCVTLFSTVNTVPGFEHAPDKLIVAAANGLAAAGAEPVAFQISAVLPTEYEEGRLKADMKACAEMADAEHAQIIGGHTQISSGVIAPMYSVTGIGRATKEQCRQDERLRPEYDLVVTGWIALAGTAALALRYEQELRGHYPLSLIEHAKAFDRQMAVGAVARAITHFGTAAVHDLSQGGIFNALWEMADRAGVGLEVDLKKIPVRQETIEICEYFDVNPYYLYSAGALLVGTEHGEALVSHLAAQGIFAAVIGRATGGKDRVIRNGEECRYLDRPKQDELGELAILLGSSEAVIANEVAQMEKEQVICGYHTLIDWEKTSSEKVTALIEVRVTPQRGQGFDSIAERIYNYPEVQSVYLISGAYDLLVILEGKTLRDVSSFVSDKLSTLDTVLSTATHFILKKYKDYGTIFGKKSKDERMLVTP